MSQLNRNRELQNPPGHGVLQLIERKRFFGALLHHVDHLPQIIDDHVVMWFEAKNDDEKRAVHARFRRQMRRTLLGFGGFEVFLHGVVVVTGGNIWVGGSLLLLGAAVVWATRPG